MEDIQLFELNLVGSAAYQWLGIQTRGGTTVQIQTNFGDIETSQALADHVTTTVESTLDRFAHRITRVEVHLRDDKQKRRGPDDHRCTMEARPTGEKPLAAEAKAGDIYGAVRECSNKLSRVITRRFEKQESPIRR